ncbi:hypothetical protein [Polyangium aurulentum]|uniref:hypothetical protein n=1 Tax=Polyangium aurulentum TaxID=2567896 RepID=UPI00200D732F|nr:hypothetical protein [Polyangium aurulentum]UQA57385.1 hypothetical protein E8A73_039865 [Polyangium aurulentum]
MMSSSFRRLSLLGVFALSIVACGNKENAPAPAPDKTPEGAKLAPVDAKPEAKAEDKAEPKPADPMALADKQPEKGDGAGDKAPAQAKTPAASGGKAAPLPDAPNGILPKGAADKIIKLGGKPVVRLIEAGAEPRATVSYALKKGPTKPFSMGMDMQMGMKAGGMNLPATSLPRMIMLFDLAAGDRTAAGDWLVDGKLQRVDVEAKGPAQEKIAGALRPSLDSMKGLAMTYYVDEKGRVHDVKTKLPPTMPEQAAQLMAGMNQSIESMMAPLPEEPVGTGAKWEVIGRISANGADLLQVSTFTLKDRKDTLLTLDVGVKQLAAKDEVNAPGMPPGTTARIKSFQSGGTGSSSLDTTDVAPKSGTMNMKSAMSLEVKMPGGGGAPAQAQDTAIETIVGITFARPAK